MKKRKSLAIIGIGQWGKKLLKEFNKIADIHLAFHNGNEENSDWIKKEYPNIKLASSLEEVLDNSKLDAVVIATPIKTHYEIAKKALLAGKNVFVEKPLSETTEQAQELAELSAGKGLTLFVGHIFSYDTNFDQVRLLAKKENFKYVGFFWNKYGSFKEGIMPNLGCHAIAMALELFGEPLKIEILENQGFKTTTDIMFARMSFENNKVFTIYINRVSSSSISLVLHFKSDENNYRWADDSLQKLNKDSLIYEIKHQASTSSLEIECKEFMDCLTNKKVPLTDGRFGLKVVEIMSKF